MMVLVDVLTWLFRSAFIVGAVLAAIAAITWHRRSRGEWRERPGGIMQMTLIVSLAVVLTTVSLRIVTGVPAVKDALPGVDLAVLVLALVAVWGIVVALARFLIFVRSEQPNYRNNVPDGPGENGSGS